MRIDVHAHLVPQRALDLLEKDSALYNVKVQELSPDSHCLAFTPGPTIRPFLRGLRDMDMRWEHMERAGIDHQILSVWGDCFGYSLEPEKGMRWNRLLNETLAEVARKFPDRLSMMASVPLQDGDLAARELEYGVKECGAVGGVIAANLDGGNLDHPGLQSFWAAAAQLDVPIFIHPTQPVPLPRTAIFNLTQVCQYTYDSTVTVGCLLHTGVLDHYPSLNFILSHGGGYFPYQVGRFDVVYHNYSGRGEFPTQPPSTYLRRFYYDTILHAPEPLRFLRELVGVDRLLLGTDFPFPVQDPDPVSLYRRAGFTEEEIDSIAYDNSARLFKLGTAVG